MPDNAAVRRAVHRWHEDDPVRARIRQGAMHMQACRLFECGYESHIDLYSAADLLLLATMCHAYQAAVLLIAGMDRADARLLYCMEQEGVDLAKIAILRRAAAGETAQP
jgi:hypothetical protein